VHRFGGNVSKRHGSFSLTGINLQYSLLNFAQSQNPLSITVVPCSTKSWRQLLRDTHQLRWVDAEKVFPHGERLPFAESIPILFWGEGYEDCSKPFVERRQDGSIVFYADIIASTFFMLTRWEETVSPVRDVHGRFPASASVAFKQGFLDRPVVDEYAMILQSWIKTLLPEWEPQTPLFSVKLSHDIDSIRVVSVRRVVGDLLKRRNISSAVNSFCQLIRPSLDPAYQGCYRLADLSEKYAFQSAFYFMAAQRSLYDSGYDIQSKNLIRLIHDLRHRGHEIGFHPSYLSFSDPERFLMEKQRLDVALGSTKYGGRQHYLGFSVPDSWRMWNDAGLKYDSTVGYADCEGFRCGTCHSFHPFDVEKDLALDLLEVPLIVMDVTLKQYKMLSPAEAQERILVLARRCKEVSGVFTLLWHNTSLQNDWKIWFFMYENVLMHLATLNEC
jgi:hypothetical protein